MRIIISSLEESRRVTHAALYLVDADGGGYELHGHLGPRPVERIDAAARRPFFERINATRGAVVSMEQLEREHTVRAAGPGARDRDDRRHRAHARRDERGAVHPASSPTTRSSACSA